LGKILAGAPITVVEVYQQFIVVQRVCEAGACSGRGTKNVDDKVLQELKFHQQIVGPETNSPLYLIREKELEISGRILATRKHAEEIVADARKRAAEIRRLAEIQGQKMAKEHEKAVQKELESEIAAIEAQAEAEVEALEARVAERIDDAVDFVVKALTKV